MEVFAASDGWFMSLERGLGEYESLDQLLEDVAGRSGVSAENVLLFLEDGTELKQDVIAAAWERGGEGSASTGVKQKLYLFDRDTFWADPETSAARFQEEIQLPPQLPLMAIQDVAMVQHPFMLAADHIQHLQSLFLAQAAALNIAYANLHAYLSPFIKEFGTFAPKAENELDTEKELLRSAKGDMAMLSKVVVHDVFTKKKDRDGDNVKTMADYVNAQKMMQVRDSCQATHDEHIQRYNTLVAEVESLTDQSDAEKRQAEDRIVALTEEFDEALNRIDMALAQVEHLVGTGVEGAIQNLAELDRAMREDLNDFTLDLHVHLRQIASFQSSVVTLAPSISALEGDLASKTAFPHLYRLKNLPFAYAATVVEVVKRKEYGQFLDDWTNRLKQTLVKFTDTETARRLRMKEETLYHIPFPIPGLDESAQISVSIKVESGHEALRGINMDRKDIDGLIQWVDKVKKDPDVLNALDQGDPHPVEYLSANLDKLIRNMDTASHGLNKLIREQVLAADADAGVSASELRSIEAAKSDLAKQLQDKDAQHETRVMEMQDQHENRTMALQNRQAELQEELVRLRTDLSEEMLARQALSTQLGDTAREQEERQREHDDQAELIISMQAELAQEKDRATDLGVRLQEALLDVDGLRNAEHALSSQVQQLQDERSKSMQAVSDAQVNTRSLESQLAGLRAELEATTEQLSTAVEERDAALKSQSAEAERLMRDHIAEADGDRAVLEHQNLNLTKQVEDLRVEIAEKLTAAKNLSIRQADGLKAELQFTKAQLRDAQRRETVLADELAMARDTATQITQQNAHQSDVARDAVALVSKYHDSCQRLWTVINTSSTINASTGGSKILPNTNEMVLSHSGSTREDMRDSILVTSLGVAQAFDIAGFVEAVQRTITMTKKWSKSCKSYRELARNRISFTNFSKGDLALFLPTRGGNVKCWACFNVSAPHNFLKVEQGLQEQVASREWLIARIVKTDEATAAGGESVETNPYGLADGLRYWVHTVEEYSPSSAPVRPPRRSVSTSYYGKSMEEQMTPQKGVDVDKTPSVSLADGPMSPTTATKIGYFPLQDTVTSPEIDRSSPPRPEIDQGKDEDDSSQSAQTDGPPQASPPAEETMPVAPAAAVPKTTRSRLTEDLKRAPSQLSPVTEVAPSIKSPSAPPPTAVAPMDVTQAGVSQTETTQPSRPSSRSHYRAPSRIASPTSRDLPPPVFAPSSFGRPASVASSGSSYPSTGAPFATNIKAAPAMAITTSNDSQEVPDPFKTISRRQSSTTSLREVFAGARPSPLGSPASPGSSGFQSLAAVGQKTNTPSPGTSPGMGASRLIRGFSLRKRRDSGNATISAAGAGSSAGGQSGADAKPTAMDMLKRLESGGREG